MRTKKIIAAIAAFILISCCISACDFLPSVVFKCSVINIKVGEQKALSDIINGSTYIATVEDESVACIHDDYLVGLEEGETKLLATQGLAKGSVKIIVRQAAAYEIEVKPEKTSSSVKQEYEFCVKADQSVVAAQWYVGDELKLKRTTEVFTFTPEDFGVYIIKAEVGDKTFTKKIIYYRAFSSVTPVLLGANRSEISEPYSSCEYEIEKESIAEIPEDQRIVEWYVGDAMFEVSDSLTFRFTPSAAGKYEIYAVVNGIRTSVKTVIAYGKPLLSAGAYDFDSAYPDIFVTWDSSVQVDYSITIDGKTYDKTNAVERFDGTKFNVKDLINLKKGGTVKINSVASEYYTASEPLIIDIRPFSDDEIDYLAAKYAAGNYYMTDRYEFFDFVSYIVAFRPNPVEREYKSKLYPSCSATVYMGYTETTAISAAKFVEEAFKRSNQTGSNLSSVSSISDLVEGSKISFTLTFITENEPTNIDVSKKTKYEQLIKRSFEGGYTDNALTAGSGVEVSRSEELYWVAERGLRPIPKSGSAAQRLYNKAKSAVAEAVSEGMTDEQKADAVYTWIMQNNTYDYEVTQSGADVTQSVKQPAYYIEGVLDYGFAVCDGISKTYTLMCAIAGLDCVRVVGDAGSVIKSGHAWNKVKIDGEWYTVDATWGDSKIGLLNKEYELGSHEYFLRTDEYMRKTHVENYSDMYPVTSVEDYDWYGKKRSYSGGYYSFKVSNKSSDENNAYYCSPSDIIKFIASDIKYGYRQGSQVLESDVYAIEVMMTDSGLSSFMAIYRGEFERVGISSSRITVSRSGGKAIIVINKK